MRATSGAVGHEREPAARLRRASRAGSRARRSRWIWWACFMRSEGGGRKGATADAAGRPGTASIGPGTGTTSRGRTARRGRRLRYHRRMRERSRHAARRRAAAGDQEGAARSASSPRATRSTRVQRGAGAQAIAARIAVLPVVRRRDHGAADAALRQRVGHAAAASQAALDRGKSIVLPRVDAATRRCSSCTRVDDLDARRRPRVSRHSGARAAHRDRRPADDRLGAGARRRIRPAGRGAWATAAATTIACCRTCGPACPASPARSTADRRRGAGRSARSRGRRRRHPDADVRHAPLNGRFAHCGIHFHDVVICPGTLRARRQVRHRSGTAAHPAHYNRTLISPGDPSGASFRRSREHGPARRHAGPRPARDPRVAGRAGRRARAEGPDRAHFLLERLIDRRARGGRLPAVLARTPRTSTRSRSTRRPRMPGDHDDRAQDPLVRPLERDGDGAAREQGTPSSAATSRASSRPRRSTTSASTTSGTRRPTSTAATSSTSRATRSPGIYARAFMLEGRLTEEQLRQLPPGGRRQGHLVLPAPVADAGLLAVPDGVDGPRPADGDLPGALPEVPAGPRPRRHRRAARSGRSWATARWTSPSRWARSRWPAREKLDNLIFVINCNLQRLDGPVRGNGKIIQELESDFRGAGWNVIKVIWGSRWDPLLAQRQDGHPAEADGGVRRRRVPDVQVARTAPTCASTSSASTPELKALVADMSDDEIWTPEPRRPRPAQGLRRLRRGGEAQGPADGDPRQDGQGLRHGRGRRRPEHHPPAEEDDAATRCSSFRDRFEIPIPDDQLDDVPFIKLADGQPGDGVPARAPRGAGRLPAAAPAQGRRRSQVPPLAAFERLLEGHRRARDLDDDGVRADAAARWCATRTIGKHIVPIVPDESRTFGMEGMFRQLGIYPAWASSTSRRTPTS